MRRVLLLLLLMATPLAAQTRIRELTPTTADAITDDTKVLFGVDKTDIPGTRSLSLDELKKTGVQVINVKQYGAAGDGVADDVEEIQAAIDAAPVGSIVFFPQGTYLISATLNLNKGITLAGAGRGHEGSTTASTVIKWGGGTSDIMLHVNTGTGQTVHGWTIKDLSLDGDAVAGVAGITLGAGNLGTPRSACGVLENLWIYDCADAGVDCWTAQLCRFSFVHVSTCGDGFRFSAGTNYANTATTVQSCRATNCARGYNIHRLTGSSFIQCTAENNDDQGVYIATGGTDEQVINVSFYNLWVESNLASGGTGRGQVETTSTGAAVGSTVNFYNIHVASTPASNHDLLLSGGVFLVENPSLYLSTTGVNIKGTSAGFKTYVFGNWQYDPSSFASITAGTGVQRGCIVQRDNSGVAAEAIWIAQNAAFARSQRVERFNTYVGTSMLAASTTASGGDTTPSSQGKMALRLNDGSPRTYTDFDLDTDGQILFIVMTNGNSTIQHNANIQLNGSADFNPTSGGALLLYNYSGVWYEVGRSAL